MVWARKIPVFALGDHQSLVGMLYLGEEVTDASLIETTVSWCYRGDTKQLVEVALVPQLPTAPVRHTSTENVSYENKSLSELFELWQNNWKALVTGVQTLLGDDPFPDPREIAPMIAEMPEETWQIMLRDEEARKMFNRTMDLQKVMGDMQVENIAILRAALDKVVE